MFIWFLVGVSVLAVGGWFFLGKSSGVEESKESFLEKICQYVDGSLKTSSVVDNSQQICFHFEGIDLVFEVDAQIGFKGSADQYYLKTQLTNDFSLNFRGKERKNVVTRGVLMASDIPDVLSENDFEVQLPEVFKAFEVMTNNKALTQDLFNDPKVIEIFKRYTAVDGRGVPVAALKIMNGQLVLRFQDSRALNPCIFDLKQNIAVIEDLATQMRIIAQKVIQFSQK